MTHIVYLFTNVLPKPFYYPYPVVSMIPDEEEYLNAPFPIVYGYLKSKKFIIESRIHKDYRNVYVFITKNGTEILSADPIRHTLAKRSYKLK